MPRARPSTQPDIDNHDDDDASSSDPDDARPATSGQDGFITKTAFDAYFIQAASRPHVSSHVFSDLLPPLSLEEFHTAIRGANPRLIALNPPIWSQNTLFSQFGWELDEGFNLLFYGLGSKRAVLNRFASEYCSPRGHVVVVNGFQPELTLKDLVVSVEKVPGLSSTPPPGQGIEGQIRRIVDFFARSRSRRQRLFLVVHNIDAPVFRSPRAKSTLSHLATSPNIHIVASVDHIYAPLLWASSESSTRKREEAEEGEEEGMSEARGFAWLWHDLTTLAPYDAELSFADRSSITGASTIHTRAARKLREGGGGGPMGQGGSHMTETAALHILASVTQKAKKLFKLVGTRQLQRMDESAAAASSSHSFDFDMLFTAVRDSFIATNDTALRALLGEFRDHGLVVGVQGSAAGTEALWIPLRKERLASVLEQLER